MAEPKQERAVRTREQLIDAAAEVFDENGFAGAGINKILVRAGLTAGAMYFHFKSKEELARAVIREQASRLVLPEEAGGLQQLIDLTMYLSARLRHDVLFRAGVRLAVEQGESGLNDFTVYELWSATFEHELTAAHEQEQLLPGVEEKPLAQLLVAAYTGTQVMSDIAGGRVDLPDRVVTMWRYLLPGLVPPEALSSYVIDPARKDHIAA